jgi:uncharacterized protein YndB with AHSA1/START domain
VKTESRGSTALVDLKDGDIVASVDIAAPPERVFHALTSREIVEWWVNPGVFDTREWSGDVRVGGRWRASGIARGAPYVLEGEYLEVDPPRALAHTWHLVGSPEATSTVRFALAKTERGTRLTLRHTGVSDPRPGTGAVAGWQSSLTRLIEHLGAPS